MPTNMSLKIDQDQLNTLQEALKDGEFMRRPRQDFLERAGTTMLENVLMNAPVDTGLGTGSITLDIEYGDYPVFARVSTDSLHLRYLEYGTGIFAEHKKRHWPPAYEGGKLDMWARTRGFKSGYQMATIIGMRGGIPGKFYFKAALERAKGEIVSRLQRLADDITRAWKDNL